jgi:hypothetical protein
MSGTNGTSGYVTIPLVDGKIWFNENINLNVSKIRLNTWKSGYLIPINISKPDTFLAKNEECEVAEYEYKQDWKLITPILYIVDETEKAIQDTYYIRESDGIVFYRHMRANLLKSVLMGLYTDDEADEIDVKVEKAIGKILTGDWKSAYRRLTEVPVEGAFTQEYKDYLLHDIGAYISDNY